MSDLKEFIGKLANGDTLSREETQSAFKIIMAGDATDAQIGAVLMAMRVRGETEEEFAGAVDAMRTFMLPVEAPQGAIDCCGTGGDASGTYNISTAVAIVSAACGVPVAKHGNRAASSKSGAADVLEALGANLDISRDTLEDALQTLNFCFLMAPNHHQAIKHVMPARKAIGNRTIFNLLGPLANPAGTKHQLIGVSSP